MSHIKCWAVKSLETNLYISFMFKWGEIPRLFYKEDQARAATDEMVTDGMLHQKKCFLNWKNRKNFRPERCKIISVTLSLEE